MVWMSTQSTDEARAIRLTGLSDGMRIFKGRIMEEEGQMAEKPQIFHQYGNTNTPYTRRGRESGRDHGGESVRPQIIRDITETIKKEIVASMPTSRKARKNKKPVENATEATGKSGMFYLELTASQSHLNKPPTPIRPPIEHNTISMANENITAQQK